MTRVCDGVTPIPYRHLDPGIRDLVRAIADRGFQPCDSGDGVSKPPAGRVFDFAHVFMRVDPGTLVGEADRLHALLPALGCAGWTVEATYRPEDGHGVLALLDLRGDL